jgi:hypothetical protein
MTQSYSTASFDACQDPSRWPRLDAATVLLAYDDAANSSLSQRRFADLHGVPRSTLQYWLSCREDYADLDPPLAAFFLSPAGDTFLRSIVVALFVVFQQSGLCGLRPLSQFLSLTKLDRFVASSYGSLQRLGCHFQRELPLFAQEEQQRLGPQMPAKRAALCLDENFHGQRICLVALEAVSNFILLETYASQRDSATWVPLIRKAVEGLPLSVVLTTSDRASGLIATAEELLAEFFPDLFHGQHDLHKQITFPLVRQCQAASKEVEKAEKSLEKLKQAQQEYRHEQHGPGRPPAFEQRIAALTQQHTEALQRQLEAQTSKEQAAEAIRGLGDDLHPYDPASGRPLSVEQVDGRMSARMAKLDEIARAAGLPEKSQKEVERGACWAYSLLVPLGWWLEQAQQWLQGLDLAEDVAETIREKLLPGLYWQMAANKGRDAQQRQQRRRLAAQLLEEAWAKTSPLEQLSVEQRQRISREAIEVVGLYQRSSSAVEGRNSRLALLHHGKAGLSAEGLAALTVIHNYLSRREDGSTAAERFFEQKPRDLFAWLLHRLPDLPRPAAKRPRKASPCAISGD